MAEVLIVATAIASASFGVDPAGYSNSHVDLAMLSPYQGWMST